MTTLPIPPPIAADNPTAMNLIQAHFDQLSWKHGGRLLNIERSDPPVTEEQGAILAWWVVTMTGDFPIDRCDCLSDPWIRVKGFSQEGDVTYITVYARIRRKDGLQTA